MSHRNWRKLLQGSSDEPGIMIVRASRYGLNGEIVAQLALGEESIKAELLNANQKFAKVEERKDYSTHVRQGKREGVYFENAIPYGEDRDGDGQADPRRKRVRGRE